jgi:hypothetical protein
MEALTIYIRNAEDVDHPIWEMKNVHLDFWEIGSVPIDFSNNKYKVNIQNEIQSQI